jgi:hypothetical protein
MAETEPCTPSQADSSGSIAVATYNIRSGCNGGLESTLRAMEGMGVDLGILLETKVTDGIYTQKIEWIFRRHVERPQRTPRWDCPLLATQQIIQG